MASDIYRDETMPGIAMWFVTVEKNGKRQVRRIAATSADEAGRKVCALIGGPNAAAWRVVRCTSAD